MTGSDDATRVVVTGLGLVTPLGNDVASNWEGLLAGRSGISPITEFDVSDFSVRFGGVVRDLDQVSTLSPKERRTTDPFIHFGMCAALEAINDAGIDYQNGWNGERTGVVLGSGIGGIGMIEDSCRNLFEKGPRRVSPFLIPGSIVNMLSGEVSIRCGFYGPNFAVPTACATGAHSIGLAADCIVRGRADTMVAGGSEHSITPLSLAGFAATKALSTRNDDPQAASRPWDRGRDGFVLAEGAGALILESYAHAKGRGAKIYGELVGFGMSGDGHHKTLPPEDGRGAASAMRSALREARTDLADVGYVNAHGTSTRLGDIAESKAIASVFKDLARKPAVSSTKSMTGHMLGAAGACEAAYTLLALAEQKLPPTINHEDPEEGSGLDYVPNCARDASFDVALTNSFGFGGTNTSLVFRRL